MIKEAQLVIRVIFTLIIVLFFSGITGITAYLSLCGMGLTVFVLSLLLQYREIIPFAQKFARTPQAKRSLISVLLFASIMGMALSALMAPASQDMNTYESEESFARDVGLWGSIFGICGSFFIGTFCARRTLESHNDLG